MTTSGRRATAGPGLRARWTLALLATSAVLVIVVAGGLEWARQRAAADAADRWARDRRLGVEASLRAHAAEAAAAAAGIAGTAELGDLIQRTRGGDDGARRVLADWAGTEAARRGVDDILVLDRDDRVLSSAQDPSAAGERFRRAADLREAFAGVPVVFDAGPVGAPLWMVGVIENVGPAAVVVARSLDSEALTAIRDGLGIAALRWGSPRRDRGERRFDLPADWQPGTGAFLTWDPGPAAAARALDALRWWILGAGVLALLVALAAAPWVAAGLGRPLEQMAAAVTEIGHGARRLDLPDRGPAEVRVLRDAIEQLARDLDVAERQMRRSERRAAWSEIARRVAHEIRNALSPLSLAVDNVETLAARDDLQSREALAAGLRIARDQLGSLDRLVGEFRDFARQPRPQLASIPVGDLVDAAVASARAARPDIRFEVRIDDATPPTVRADVEQLRRALINVLANAADAAADGPVAAPVETWIRSGADASRWTIEVADRGPGLAADVAARLGDPYVTTKPHGTGLGLPITMGIVEGHGGTIDFEARDGGGLVVRVVLPVDPPLPVEPEGDAW